MPHTAGPSHDPVASAALRLLDGSGEATLAVRGSTNRSDVLPAQSHRWLGDGRVRVTGTPAPWSDLVSGAGVVIAIDEYAPVSGARVLTASLHARGEIVAASEGDGWAVSFDVAVGEVAVRRLGESGVVRADHLHSGAGGPLTNDAPGLEDEIRARFGDGLARLTGARRAHVLGVDPTGVHVLTGEGADADVVRLPFRAPVATRGDVLREVERLFARAS